MLPEDMASAGVSSNTGDAEYGGRRGTADTITTSRPAGAPPHLEGAGVDT